MLKNKQILCFFSPGCTYCRFAARKLTIIQERMNRQLPVKCFFFGSEQDIKKFWKVAESSLFNYQIIEAKVFFEISGSRLPSILFVKDSSIVESHGYVSLNQENITKFLY